MVTSFKLSTFFSDLINPSGQKVLQFLGDSINAVNTADRMQDGYRECWSIPWNGYVQGVDSTTFWGYANRQGTMSLNATISPLAPNYGGTAATVLTDVSGKMPLRWAETVWSVNPTVQGDNYALAAGYTRMAGRNSWMFRNSATVNAKALFYENARLFTSFNVRGRRNTTNQNVVAYTKPGSPSNGIVGVEVSCGVHATQDPNLIINGFTGFSSGTIDAIPYLGTRFRSTDPDGVQYQAISHGGFTTGDHITTNSWSDAALEQWYTQVGVPTHIVLWLGQNTNPGTYGLSEQGANSLDTGHGTNYKANLLAIIARHEARIAAIGGASPKWLLVTQYKTGYNQTYYDTMAAVHQQISNETPNVSWVNLYELAGGYAMDITTSFALSDGVHPTASGARYFAGLIFKEAQRSIAASGSSRSQIIGFGF